MFDKDVLGLVRQGDVVPISVMESRSPATQLMGNVRYDIRSGVRVLEGLKEERSKLDAGQRSIERRLESAQKNLDVGQKACGELREKVRGLAKALSQDEQMKKMLAQDMEDPEREDQEGDGMENLEDTRGKSVRTRKGVGMEM